MDMGMKFDDMGMTFDDMGMRIDEQTSSNSTLKQSLYFKVVQGCCNIRGTGSYFEKQKNFNSWAVML